MSPTTAIRPSSATPSVELTAGSWLHNPATGELARYWESAELTARVREDFMSGVRSGVNGTPTFFINGERFDGDWRDVDAFTKALQEAAATQVPA